MMGYCNREGLLREYRMAVARRLQKDQVVQPGKAERSIAEKLAGAFKLTSNSEIIQNLAAKIEKSYLGGDPEGKILVSGRSLLLIFFLTTNFSYLLNSLLVLLSLTH